MLKVETNKKIKGYKIFRPDWNGTIDYMDNIVIQYTCPWSFGPIDPLYYGHHGFHFFLKLSKCLNFYNYTSDYHVAEVTGYGIIIIENENVCCANNMRIEKELKWEEVLQLVNIEKNIEKTLKKNIEDNSEEINKNQNIGIANTGIYNVGNKNIGVNNYGDKNIGGYNIGNNNSGNFNAGNKNVGDKNIGNNNLGDFNTGNNNLGDFNVGNNIFGIFNRKKQPFYCFDQISNWTIDDWEKSEQKNILSICPTDKFLAQKWYDKLDDDEKTIIKNIPNFDAEIFKEITGIDVN